MRVMIDRYGWVLDIDWFGFRDSCVIFRCSLLNGLITKHYDHLNLRDYDHLNFVCN